jgi:hypothetical protein
MKRDGKVGCGCLIFVLICVLVGVGLSIHPISLRFLGGQLRYEDRISPSDVIFVPRFEEDRGGEAYVEAFREYWAENSRVIYVEEGKMFGASILEPVHRMARARGIKEAQVKKIEAEGEGSRKAYKIKAQFAAMGVKKVIVLVPEYASRRYHLLYGDSGHEGKTVFLIKPVNVSYFKRDGWWKNGDSRLLFLDELFSVGSLSIEKFKRGDSPDRKQGPETGPV